MKFYTRADFLGTKLLVFHFRRLPEQTRMQKYIYSNFANFNPRAIVNTLCRKSNALQNGVFTRQRLARAIIDAETLRSLFVNISRIFGVSRRNSGILFSHMHTDERNHSPSTLNRPVCLAFQLRFYYHMQGLWSNTIGRLRVRLRNTITGAESDPLWERFGHQGSQWNRADVPINTSWPVTQVRSLLCDKVGPGRCSVFSLLYALAWF